MNCRSILRAVLGMVLIKNFNYIDCNLTSIYGSISLKDK